MGGDRNLKLGGQSGGKVHDTGGVGQMLDLFLSLHASKRRSEVQGLSLIHI